MWRYPDGTFRLNAPARLEQYGMIRPFSGLTREELNELGYNEALPLKRDPYTVYVTAWIRGEDLVFRETAVSAVVDEAARDADLAGKARAERDRLLAESDWTQLADAPLADEEKAAWATKRQAWRDVPQQAGFPGAVEWPEAATV
ncbi:tail fiber assembly protein [Desulfovibrio sp. Fe33]|uniref:tail fiber assembly protein n=1 Tax=Desulfovibrio sp. Fe33 TaxID=3020842 RepID=UPI00234E1D58|nr:tail fiber assembly protein [Desulfovibrio sp. Fe33]